MFAEASGTVEAKIVTASRPVRIRVMFIFVTSLIKTFSAVVSNAADQGREIHDLKLKKSVKNFLLAVGNGVRIFGLSAQVIAVLQVEPLLASTLT
jgi:hypothetical protein